MVSKFVAFNIAI